MIRIVVIVFLLLAFLIIGIPIMLLLLCLRRFNKHGVSCISQGIVAWMFRVMLFVTGSKIEIRGKDNIPQDGGVLFVSNHRSYFDILMGYGYTPKLLGFVAKAEMLKYPLLKQWMDLVNCLFLDRTDMKKGLKTILKGIEQVKAGYSVWICPEGTRSKLKDPTAIAEFHEGSLKIADKAGCAIVPVALTGTSEIFEQHLPFIKPSHVIMEYGKPIYVSELPAEDRKRAGAYTREVILEMIKKNMIEV